MQRLVALAILALSVGLAGCEYAFSDVATRIRYRLLSEMAGMKPGEEKMIALRPDHWPDRCPGDGGYRLVVSAYKGGKVVASGDIAIKCRGSNQVYYTGLGSEQIAVPRELAVEKRPDQDLLVKLRRTAGGLEIVALE